MNNIQIKNQEGKWMLEYEVDENFKQICDEKTGVCYPDKSEIHKILLEAIARYNQSNPWFKIYGTQIESKEALLNLEN